MNLNDVNRLISNIFVDANRLISNILLMINKFFVTINEFCVIINELSSRQCEFLQLRINFIEFVNDVNILTYEKSTKRNCKIVNEIYIKCEQWAQTHDTKFSKLKHELIHFSKTSKRFNMSVCAKLTSHQVESKTNIKVLRVQLNFKLK